MTIVNILAGFLGAGKTTALLAQLAQRRGRERVAVLVNDFGEAAIDARIVDAEGGVAVTEIQGACVCCTAPAGFLDALGHLLDTVHPDRIFIEPTGLARPSDLLDTIGRSPHAARVELGPLVVVVDPHAFAVDPLVREQAEAADVIVASHVDLATDAELAAFDAWVAELWPGPLYSVRAVRGGLPRRVFDWPEGVGPRAHHAAHDHEGGHDFSARSLVWPPDVVFSRERLGGAFAASGAARIKGLFRTDDGTWRLDLAGGRVHEAPSGWRRDSRADLIVAGAADLDAIAAALEGAVLTEAERRLDADRLDLILDRQRRSYDRAALAALPGGVDDVSTVVPKRQGRAARLAPLLADVADDREVILVAADGMTTPPVPARELRDALVVHSLGEGPLPAAQGGPFRLLIPGESASPCANVKGVVRIVVR